MRPLYETKEHIARESMARLAVELAWDCDLRKLPLKYHLDYSLHRGSDEVRAYAEIKDRGYTMEQLDKMGGFFLSVHKWNSAMGLCETAGVPFMVVVSTLDGIWWTKFETGTFEHDGVQRKGRTDRGDWQDIEPCVLLRASRFKRMPRVEWEAKEEA